MKLFFLSAMIGFFMELRLTPFITCISCASQKESILMKFVSVVNGFLDSSYFIFESVNRAWFYNLIASGFPFYITLVNNL